MIGGITFCRVLSHGPLMEVRPNVAHYLLASITGGWIVSLVGLNDYLPQLRGHDLEVRFLELA
jgi:hypothetical protein